MDVKWVRRRVKLIENMTDKEDVLGVVCSLHKDQGNVTDTSRFWLRMVMLCCGFIENPLDSGWEHVVSHTKEETFKQWLQEFLLEDTFSIQPSLTNLKIAQRLLHQLIPKHHSVYMRHNVHLYYVLLRLWLKLIVYER